MGVLGLWQLLAPVGQPVALESLENKIFAVDISIWLNQAVKGYRDAEGGSVPNAHLLSLFSRLCKLLFYRIRPIIVFDGGFPELKKQTIINRQQRRAALKQSSRDIGLRILTNYLASQNLASALPGGGEGEGTPKRRIIRHREKVRDELFALPPLPSHPQIDPSPEEIESIEWKFTNFSKEDVKYLNQIDLESEDFNSLPADVKQEILSTLKESRRHRSWGTELPEDSDAFSSYQMQCLLKKRTLQQKLEQVQKDVRRINSADFVAQYTNDHVIGETNKIMSDDCSHYVLLKKIVQKSDKTTDDGETSMMETKNAFITDMENIDVDDVEGEKKDASFNLNSKADCISDVVLDSDAEDTKRRFLGNVNVKTEMRSEDSDSEEDIDNPPSTILRNDRYVLEVERPKFETELPTDNQKMISSGESCLKQTTADKFDTTCSEGVFKSCNAPMLENDGQTSKIENDGQTSKIENDGQTSKIENDGQSSRTENASLTLKIENNGQMPKIENAGQTSKIENDGLTSSIENDGQTSFVDAKVPLPLEDSAFTVSSSEDEMIPCEEVDVEALYSQSALSSELNSAESQDKADVLGVPLDTDKNLKETTCVSIGNQDACNAKDVTEILSPVQMTETSSAQDQQHSTAQEFQPTPSTSFASQREAEVLLQLQEDLESATSLLEADRAKQERQSGTVQDHMVADCKELLRLFGIPFVVSPSEAEAQCAFYDAHGVTHGTITDDSDVWLFGGTRVYKNFFAQQKHVELYKSQEIFSHFGLSRKKLVNFALLTGSDYTVGLEGVGPVTAMEVLAEFPGDGLEALEEFKDWWRLCNRGARPPENKVRAKLLKLVLGEKFPEREVFDAYLSPVVDDSQEKFSWGRPDLDSLRDYARERFGWNKSKVDDSLLPVIRKLSERDSQTHIDNFFTVSLKKQKDLFPSKRIMSALKKIKSPQKSSPTKAKKRKVEANKRTAPKKSARKALVLSEESSDEEQ